MNRILNALVFAVVGCAAMAAVQFMFRGKVSLGALAPSAVAMAIYGLFKGEAPTASSQGSESDTAPPKQ